MPSGAHFQRGATTPQLQTYMCLMGWSTFLWDRRGPHTGMTLGACPDAHLGRANFCKLVPFCTRLHALMGRPTLPAGPVQANHAVLQAAMLVPTCFAVMSWCPCCRTSHGC